MTIKNITEIENKDIIKQKPIKETMDIYIPDIPNYLPNRNGFISVYCGSGGSGKTSLLLGLFKSKKLYRSKFHNLFYICPMSSFLSVEKHPLADHDKVYHELTVEVLEDIYNQLIAIKETEDEPEYSCLFIDDMASSLKDNDIQKQLNKMLIKARHIQCAFIFTLQSYYYFPLMLRKQITNLILFKTKNKKEFEVVSGELLNLNKDDSLTLYNYVFDAPYNHLDVDTVSNKLYKNFNELILDEN